MITIRSQCAPDETVTREELIEALYLALTHSRTSYDTAAARIGFSSSRAQELREQADELEKRDSDVSKARQVLRRVTGKNLEWYT